MRTLRKKMTMMRNNLMTKRAMKFTSHPFENPCIKKLMPLIFGPSTT
jgi:hypothetical protein